MAAQFAAAGLTPAGTDGTWFQSFTVRRRTLDSSEISYLGAGGPQILVNGQDVALDASPEAIDERLDLELVFVGWGIDAPHLGQDDYAGLDVRGKAVVLLEGGPETLSPALRAHYSWIQQKERMAAARGATAVLTLKAPAREKYSPWERTRRVRPLAAVSWVGPRAPGEVLPPKATMTLGPAFARGLFQQAGHDLDAIYRGAEVRPRGASRFLGASRSRGAHATRTRAPPTSSGSSPGAIRNSRTSTSSSCPTWTMWAWARR